MVEKIEKETASREKRLAKPGDVVELIVGEQWVDDLSGISLYRGFYRLASNAELQKDKIAKEFGYIREDEIQPTCVIPEGRDLSRVEKGLRLGILKIYDPKHPTEYQERIPPQHRRVNDATQDSGSRYSSPDDEKIATILKMKYGDFLIELKRYKSYPMLEKIYEAECEGRNLTAGPRKMIVEAIRSRMKDSDVGGVSKITSKVSEIIKIE